MHLPDLYPIANSHEPELRPSGDFQPHLAPFGEMPRVPASSAALIQLELLCSQRSLDLEAAAQVVLSDLGLTIETFRSVAHEVEPEVAGSLRVHDCIVVLGKEGLLRILEAVPTRMSPFQSCFVRHCRDVATTAQVVAAGFPEIDPEQAYLAGLFHDISEMPEVFPGWRMPEMRSSTRAALYLCREWSLPECVEASLDVTTSACKLSQIVAIAHEVVKLETAG